MTPENRRALSDFGLGIGLVALQFAIAGLASLVIEDWSWPLLALLVVAPVGGGVVCFLRRGAVFPCAVGVMVGAYVPSLVAGGPTARQLDLMLAPALGALTMALGALGAGLRALSRRSTRAEGRESEAALLSAAEAHRRQPFDDGES